MDIGGYLSESWTITFRNPAQIFVAGIAVVVLTPITFGILGAPLTAGLMMMYVNARNGKPVVSGDVFRYLNRTLPLFFGAAIIGLLTAMGFLLIIIPGLVFMAWWAHTGPFMADQGLSPFEAMGKSREIARKNGLGMTLLFMLVCGIVGAAGSALAFFGAFFTIPMAAGMLGLSYADGKSALEKGGY